MQEFKKRNTMLVSFLGLFAGMNFGLILFIIPEYMMNSLHLDVAQIGLITSLYPIGTIIGTVIGGVLADRWGRKKTILIFLIGTLILSALLVFADSWEILAVIYSLIGFVQGASFFSAISALFMDITNPKIAGTQYSLMTSIANVGDYSVAIFSGTLVLMIGYARFFLLAAWITGPTLLVLYFVQEVRNK